jgi:hypothetical protein
MRTRCTPEYEERLKSRTMVLSTCDHNWSEAIFVIGWLLFSITSTAQAYNSWLGGV